MVARIEISKRLVLINSASSVLRKVIVVAILVWVNQYLARRLDPGELQLLPITQALIVFFPLLSLVFVSGLGRYVTDAYARGQEGEVTRLVSTVFPVVAGISVLMLALGLVGSWFIADLLVIDPEYVGQARIMFALMALGMSLRVAVSPFGMGFDLEQRFLLRNLIGLASELFRTALLLALLYHSPRVMWVVVANTTATAIELGVATAISRRLAPALRFRRSQFHWPTARPLLTFGGWSFVNRIAMIVRDSADSLILNRLSTDVQVSSYYLGGLLDRHLRLTYLDAAANAQPVVTAMNATGQAARLRQTFFRVTRYSLWSLLFPAAPLIVYREEIASLYLGEKFEVYAVAASVMALMLARVVVLFPNAMLGMLAAAKAEVRPVALRAVTLSAANLALALYLVGALDMGALGAALASVIVMFVGAPLLYWTLAVRLAEARFSDWARATLVPGMLPALFALPVWWALWRWHQPTTWLALFLGFLGGAAVYLPAVWFAGLRNERGRPRTSG